MEHGLAELIKQGILGLFCAIFLGMFYREHSAKDSLMEKRHKELMAINTSFVALSTAHNGFLERTNQLLSTLLHTLDRR